MEAVLNMELEDRVYEKIVQLCEEGDNLSEDELYEEAIERYNLALDLLPTPKTDWEASTWIYTALGDVYFAIEDYENGRDFFYNALNCPDGITNPYILLRLGECLFECEQFEKAKEYLLKAYMLEGYRIFAEEDEKYFEIIKEII